MALSFTEEQKKVIELRNRNILVSAAAGSGKTAVLVERILRLITDEKHPVDIDRLLIVTFTNAAASEMRERIGAAIEKQLQKTPESLHLQRQATLLHNAQITTIDSFCLFVLKNNFNEIDLDPGFRVMDPTEGELLKQDIINDIFEELLSGEDTKEDVIWLLETFGGKEKSLEDALLQMHNFSRSFPWPERWLQERYRDYKKCSPKEVMDSDWGKLLQYYVEQELLGMKENLSTALQICGEADGPYMYRDALESDKELLELLEKKSWEEQFLLCKEASFVRLSSKKDGGVSEEKKLLVKSMRDKVKADFSGLKKKYFALSPENICRQMGEMERAAHTFLDMVLLFGERFSEKKREKNLLDFADIEHFALNILTETEEENGEFSWRPSKTALDYSSYFYEIMIDEYQDSNLVQEYLLQSISGESENRYNRFMVGDLKQSIYKFRLARPEIFLEKYEVYTEEDSETQRIDLHKNFRSRPEVLNSVNDVFYQIMGQKLGKITYDSKAALFPGASYEDGEADYKTELLLLKKEGKDEKRREAEMVAGRILELAGSFPVTDKETGELRPARFGDMVVLLRTNMGWDEELRAVFAEYGIPASVTSKTGYFTAKEVQLILNFLRVIDNPRQDIPLYGVLKSLSGRFTEEEIVLLKSMEGENLYENLLLAASRNVNIPDVNIPDINIPNVNIPDVNTPELPLEVTEKASGLLQQIDKYRALVPVMPIHKLLRQYLKETGLLPYLAALPGGEQRVANVKMLLEKAESYEKTSYFGLFPFLRYIEQLQKYSLDTGEAGLQDDSLNAVRIMSIHKSKGLEFPICFVSGLAKKINQMDTAGAFLSDMDLGMGLEYRNPETRIKGQDLRKNLIARKMQLDNLGEELRILYVAMTRAKEKLILTGAVADYEERMLSYAYLEHYKEEKLPFGVLSRSGSFLEFLLPALIRPVDSIRVRVLSAEALEKNTAGTVFLRDTDMQLQRLQLEERLFRPHKEPLGSEAEKEQAHLRESLKEQLSFRYGHENLKGLFVKTTVSELKMAAMEEKDEAAYRLFEIPEVVPYIPEFMEEKAAVAGTTRGTAYHKVLELIEFSDIQELKDWKAAMAVMIAEGSLDASYPELLNPEKLQRFLDSPLKKRMEEAEKSHVLWKEQPFVLGLSATELNREFPPEEIVLMQGIVDAFFEEDGELVVVDYKTDAVKTEAELRKRYETQLDYYAKALHQLTGKTVKEKVMYSFGLNREVKIS